MEKNMEVAEEKLFECPECGLHYDDSELAKKCEVFCKEYNACSLEITKHSLEASKARQS